MKKTVQICLLFLSLLTIVACSSNDADEKEAEEIKPKEENVEEEQEETQEEKIEIEDEIDLSGNDIKNLPQTIEEMIQYPIGSFGIEDLYSINDEIKSVLEEIPAVPEDADQEDINDIKNYLYSLYKMPYEDPKKVIESSTLNNPDLGEKMDLTEQYNVEIVLDSSGSMANYMGSKTRMDLAKESIKEFASTLPENVHLSLRVYGHKGTGSDSDKKMSCEANELVYTSSSYNESELTTSLNSFKPAGWTPLAQSILEAKKDLKEFTSEEYKNIVYIVSDGIETCDGDPVKAAKELKDSGISPVVNVIGFDLANKDEQQLKDLASAADGNYINVKNQNQLDNELGKTIDELQRWLEWKNNESTSAIVKSSEEIQKIAVIHNDWLGRLNRERNIIIESIYYLNSSGKLSMEQTNQMISEISDFYDQHIKLIEELKITLNNLSNDNLDKTLVEIQELYDENVSN
ncbi:VWA domain-containing protein [Cytobacillus kochii]|uniref:VWA domain-containing protein n=1 Tax=Cytobacillus kochii TaxID=859143 RepID=UPI00402A80BA